MCLNSTAGEYDLLYKMVLGQHAMNRKMGRLIDAVNRNTEAVQEALHHEQRQVRRGKVGHWPAIGRTCAGWWVQKGWQGAGDGQEFWLERR